MNRTATWMIVVLLAAQVSLSAVSVLDSRERSKREQWRDWKARVDERGRLIAGLRSRGEDVSELDREQTSDLRAMPAH